MAEAQIRPATESDAHGEHGFDDLLPDRWREGGNRRSLVAVRDGRIVGHARGIDNVAHPQSRALVLEVASGPDQRGDATALTQAHLALADRPLHLKIHESMALERALTRSVGGVAIQACPPWRYAMTPDLRAWATTHRGDVEQPRASDAVELLDLMVHHYVDQHAAWSPTSEAALRVEFAEDADPGGHDPRSTIMRRDGRIVAAAMVWPPESPDGECEVSLICDRHEDPARRPAMEACLAHVIDLSDDDAVLLIDSHVTERGETAMVKDLPGPVDGGDWLAIVALPTADGPAPIALPAGLLPPEGHWIEDEFVR